MPLLLKPDRMHQRVSFLMIPTSRKRCRSRSPPGEADSHQQELDPSYVEMLNAIWGLLDLEVSQVECLVAPAFSKKTSKQVARK